MKRIINVVGTILTLGMLLMGCSTNNASSKTQSSNTEKTTTNKSSVIGKTYATKVEGESIPSTGAYYFYFQDKSHLVMSFVGQYPSNKMWYKLISKVRYEKIPTDNKDYSLKIKSSDTFDEIYSSKEHLENKDIPILFKKHSHSFVLSTSVIINKDKVRFEDGNSLYQVKNLDVNYSNFDSYVDSIAKKSMKKYAKLSKYSFGSPSPGHPENSIAFKGNKYIWKYSGENYEMEGAATSPSRYDMGIITGTYALIGNKLTLYLEDSNVPIYLGLADELENNTYTRKSSLGIEKGIVVFKKTGKILHLDSAPDQILQDENMIQNSYKDLSNYNRLAKLVSGSNSLDNKMKKIDYGLSESSDDTEDDSDDSDSETSNDGITGEQFVDFLKSRGELQSSDDYSIDDSNDNVYRIDDSDETVEAVYVVKWADGDDYFILGDDNRIYFGEDGEPISYLQELTEVFNL